MIRPGLILLSAICLIACSDTGAASDSAAQVDRPLPISSQTGQDRYAAFASVVARHQAMSDRVTQISRRLRVANAPLCSITRLDAGLTTHQLSDYPAPLRPLALHFMDLGETGRFIRSIVPGSPADQTDLAVGDRILSGWPVAEDSDILASSGLYPLNADTACVAPTFIVDSPVPNASTDGREIELSTALVEQVSDEASLAFIIAHEMAHIIRGHSPDGPRWTAELEADADALTLMRNAGYDIERTVSDWEASVEAHRMSQSMSPTHPPISIRLHNLENARDRVMSQPRGFLSLED